MSTNHSHGPVYSHPRYYYVGVGAYHIAVAVALVFVFWKVTWPQQLDQARLSHVEAELGQIKVAQSEIQQRQLTANAEEAEHRVKELQRPVIQMTPEIVQSCSLQDIREIRLDVRLDNSGDTAAVIRRVVANVEDGQAKEKASQILVATQNYFYKRLNYQNRDRDRYGPPSNLFEDDLVPTYPNQQASGTTESPPHPMPDNQVGDGEMFDFLSARLPFHADCPHGKLFALSANSPDIQWTPINGATQSLDQKQVLGPEESASLNFNYLLTEYPLQHNRQWLKFRVIVEYFADDDPTRVNKQEFTQIVSGLPTNGQPQYSYKVAKYTEFPDGSKELRGPSVWRPSAPLLPTKVDD